MRPMAAMPLRLAPEPVKAEGFAPAVEVPPMSAPLRLGFAGTGIACRGVVKIVQTEADLTAFR
jgi:hypothetical protein